MKPWEFCAEVRKSLEDKTVSMYALGRIEVGFRVWREAEEPEVWLLNLMVFIDYYLLQNT